MGFLMLQCANINMHPIFVKGECQGKLSKLFTESGRTGSQKKVFDTKIHVIRVILDHLHSIINSHGCITTGLLCFVVKTLSR